MAILKSMWITGSRKKLGGTVIYQAMGQTRQRELAASVSNPRTTSQMTQRVKWANLVNLYRANRSWMKYAYETKKTSQSEYNKFMSLNVASSGIYLPKNIASAGGCVVSDYIVTQGSLPSIEVQKEGNVWKSNIFFGDTTPLNASTTIAELTASLLPANPALRNGDQLSFIRISQQINAITGVPYVVVREYELILNTTSTDLVSNYFPLDYFQRYADGHQDCLAVKDSGFPGGFVLILSRTIAGRTYVSSQRIIVANNSDLINAYGSAAALQAAISSYGESEDAFLSTITANEAPGAVIPLSILSVELRGQVFTPGQAYRLNDTWDGADMEITLSAPLQDASAQVFGAVTLPGAGDEVITSDGGIVSGNKVTISLDSAWDFTVPSYLHRIGITVSGIDYVAVFDNSGAQGSLD